MSYSNDSRTADKPYPDIYGGQKYFLTGFMFQHKAETMTSI